MTNFLIAGILTTLTLSSLGSTNAYAYKQISKEKRATIVLLGEPQTFKAGEEIVIEPRISLPIYGATTNLCFAIGKPFKKSNSSFSGSDLQTKRILNRLFNADKNSGRYDLNQKLLEGEYETKSGQVFPIAGDVVLSRRKMPDNSEMMQISVCGKVSPHSSDEVTKIKFITNKTLFAESLSWVTSDALRYKKTIIDDIDPKILVETRDKYTLTKGPVAYKKNQQIVFNFSEPLHVSKGTPNICFAMGEPYYPEGTFDESITEAHKRIQAETPNLTMQNEFTSTKDVIVGRVTNSEGKSFNLDSFLYLAIGRTEPFQFDAKQVFLCARAYNANEKQEINSVTLTFLKEFSAQYVTWFHPFTILQ